MEVAAGIDGIFAIVEMCVAAALFRTAGRPVLDHGVHTLIAPAVVGAFGRLEAVHVGAGQVGIEVGIFAESAGEAVPARLGGQVDLRAQCRGNTQRTVLFRGDVAELADERRVEGGGQAERGRPERDLAARAGVVFGGDGRFVAGIGAVVGGDTAAQRFHKGLHVIVPAGSDFGTSDSGDKHGAQVVFFQEFDLCVGQFGRRNGLVGAVEHQAGDLLDGEAAGQVDGALVSRTVPVLIRVELSVAVEILEGVTAESEDGNGGITQCGATLLDDELIAVGRLLFPLLSAAAEYADSGRSTGNPHQQGMHQNAFLHIGSGFVSLIRRYVKSSERKTGVNSPENN